MPKRSRTANRPAFRWRLLFTTLVLMVIVAYARMHNILPVFSLPSRETFFPQVETTPPLTQINANQVITYLNEQRQAKGLSTLQENTTLTKTARLATLEVEDNDSLETEIDYGALLKAVSLAKPPEIESLTVFVSGFGDFTQAIGLEKSKLLTEKNFTQVGVATRLATIQQTNGTIIIITASPPFAESDASPQPQTTSGTRKPTFTGQDLWLAVQNYRRAQQLPIFEQSNELCTVASIRVNELLELGKLDNHDGFDARADQFFERNPGWTSINENIASGYETAVQVVEWGWDQSLGHQALIKSREFPKACAAANSGFSVLVTGK